MMRIIMKSKLHNATIRAFLIPLNAELKTLGKIAYRATSLREVPQSEARQ